MDTLPTVGQRVVDVFKERAFNFYLHSLFNFSALRVTKPLKNVEVPETHVATLECEVSHFNVPSTWLTNGVEIEMSEKFRIVIQGKLRQ